MKSIKNYKELAVSGLMMDTYQNPHFALSGGPEPLKMTTSLVPGNQIGLRETQSNTLTAKSVLAGRKSLRRVRQRPFPAPIVGLLRGNQGRDYPADSRAVLYRDAGFDARAKQTAPGPHTNLARESEWPLGDSAKQRVVSLPKGTGRSNVRPN